MIKIAISAVLIAIVVWIGNFLYSEYAGKQKAAQMQQGGGTPAAMLEGLPPELEGSLQQSQAAGAAALKQWLEKHARFVRDPALASIQLDYVMQLGRSDPVEAKRIFQQVRTRIRPDSPVHAKMKKIEPTFGR